MALVYYTTATYGTGVGTDGAIQISTADHLLAGGGFVDYAGSAFTRWPPLYPLLLAFLSRLSGLESLSLAWYLNVALFGVIVWLGGALLAACFPDEPLWAYLGSLALVTSVSLLSTCAHAGTDPLFCALALGCVLLAGQYLASGSKRVLLALGLLACLASLQRLPGVTLIALGAVVILIRDRQRLARAVPQALLFSLPAGIPLALWILIHNNLENHTLFGVALFKSTFPLFNLKNSLGKIWHWFVPYSLTSPASQAALLGLPLLTALVASRARDWQRLLEILKRPPILSALLFSGMYYSFVVMTIDSVDTRYVYFDRYYIVLLVGVLILVFAALQALWLARLPRHGKLARLAILVGFAAWLVYPAFSVYKYSRQSRLEGVVGYNLYNTRRLRQSKIVGVLQEIAGQKGQTLYSNYPAAVWFFTREDALYSPRGSILGGFDRQALLQTLSGWPGDRPGYLIWFLPNEYQHVLTPRELEKVANLELIYRGEDGEVYRVRAR